MYYIQFYKFIVYAYIILYIYIHMHLIYHLVESDVSCWFKLHVFVAGPCGTLRTPHPRHSAEARPRDPHGDGQCLARWLGGRWRPRSESLRWL